VTCPASISGACLQTSEGFTPCWDECERVVIDDLAVIGLIACQEEGG